MEKLALYRQFVQALLEKRAAVANQSSRLEAVETVLVFDTTRDHYQVVTAGWKNADKYLYYCSGHVTIKKDKIWILHDVYEVAIAGQLAELGVPKQDIVLAYHAPHVRQYTDFAVG